MELRINFLPKRKRSWQGYLNGRTGRIYFLILFLLVLGCFFIFFDRKPLEKYPHQPSLRPDFIKLSQEKDRVSSLITLLHQIKKEQINWTEKMLALEKAIPNSIFLTSLEYCKEKSSSGALGIQPNKEKLVIKGVALSTPGDTPASAIQKFMDQLKNNTFFMTGFEIPVLISVNNNSREELKGSLEFEFQLFRK